MKKANLLVFLITSLALIFFDVYKAIHASITYDEAISYLNFVNQNMIDIISYRHTDIANNHILNTLLMKLSEMLFGCSEFTLRLPNILAHILYLTFTYKLLNKYCYNYFIPFFIIANANPYMIDFFSLARGYGLAVGLITSGFYFYCRYLDDKSNKHYILSFFIMGLACVASFSILIVFMTMILAHNIFQFVINKVSFSFKNLWTINKYILIIGSIFSLILYQAIKKFIKYKLIVEGGLDGFWINTVGSLLHTFSYYQSFEEKIIYCGNILIIILSGLFLLRVIHFFVNQDEINLSQKIILFFGMILFFIIVASYMQFALLGTPFLQYRYALFIYPTFIFLIAFLISDIGNTGNKILNYTFSYLLSGMLFLHTVYSLNTSWYYEWRYMSVLDAKNILMEINNDKSNTKLSINIGSSWIYEPVLNFYRVTLKLDRLNKISSSGINASEDYFIVNNKDLLLPPKKEIVHYYPITNNYLAQRITLNASKFSVNIKTLNQKYVCDENKRIIVNRSDPYVWETFTMIKLDSSNYAIVSFEGLYLSIDLINNNEIIATNKSIGPLEKFMLIKLEEDNLVALKANNGKYLSVDEKTARLYATSESIGVNEKFEIIIKE